MHPFRLLVPEALRSLNATLLPGLLDDPRLDRLAHPERRSSIATSRRPAARDLDTLIARVLLDPNRIESRMELGTRFEDEGEVDCAVEQFGIVTELTADYAYAPLRAARALDSVGEHAEAAGFALRALERDEGSDEARQYL